MIALTLTDLQKNQYNISIESNKTIEDLKQKIATEHNADVTKIKILYNKKVMKNTEVISDLGWTSDSKISVYIPMSKAPEKSQPNPIIPPTAEQITEDVPTPAPQSPNPQPQEINKEEEVVKPVEQNFAKSEAPASIASNPNLLQARSTLLEFGYSPEVVDILLDIYKTTNQSPDKIVDLISSFISEYKIDTPEAARNLSTMFQKIFGNHRSTLGMRNQPNFANQFSHLNSMYGNQNYEAEATLKMQFESLTQEQQLEVDELFISSKLSFDEVLQIYLMSNNDIVAARSILDM